MVSGGSCKSASITMTASPLGKIAACGDGDLVAEVATEVQHAHPASCSRKREQQLPASRRAAVIDAQQFPRLAVLSMMPTTRR